MPDALRPGAARLMAQERRVNTSPVRDIQEQLDAALSGGHDPNDGSLNLQGVVTETSLTLPPNLNFEQWQQVGFTLKRINRAWKWWVGDWLNYGERTYGEMYSQAMDETGIDYGQLAQIAHVARKIDPGMRQESLSWSHHAAVAKLDKDEAVAVLTQAAEHGWNRAQVREAATFFTGEKKFTPAETLAEPLCSCCCHGEVCRECGKPVGPS